MQKFIRIGVDLAKNYFQVHALVDEGSKSVKRKLSRTKVREFFANLEPCAIGMEACGSAHFWAQEFAAMGHEVRLIPPAYSKPYIKRGKNDAVDAEAICEAMSRPGMRFVPVKSEVALRCHLAEFGLVVAKGVNRIDELLRLADGDMSLPTAADVLAKTLCELDRAITEIEQKIAEAHDRSEASRLIDSVPGVGKLIASAIVAVAPGRRSRPRSTAFGRSASMSFAACGVPRSAHLRRRASPRISSHGFFAVTSRSRRLGALIRKPPSISQVSREVLVIWN
jgi:transposase